MRIWVNPTLGLGKVSYWFDKYIIDGIINAFSPLVRMLGQAIAWIDKHIVDGIVNGIAALAYTIGNIFRFVQNGRLQNYIGFALTVILVGIIYLILR